MLKPVCKLLTQNTMLTLFLEVNNEHYKILNTLITWAVF